MKRPPSRAFEPCPCGRSRMLAGRDECRLCRFEKKRHKYERPRKSPKGTCAACGWNLRGSVCPKCHHGASMDWEQVAAVYSYRNPDDPIDAKQAKKHAIVAMAKLRRWAERAKEDESIVVGRVLLGCFADCA